MFTDKYIYQNDDLIIYTLKHVDIINVLLDYIKTYNSFVSFLF